VSAASTTNPVLIVSTGRTGTRFVAQYLDSTYSSVDAHHITAWSTLINVLSNAHLSGFLSERCLLSIWQTLKGRSFAHTNKQVFVDSNNHLFAFASIAPRLYPGVKVVHIIRDPRTYVPSHLNWCEQRFKSRVANYFVPFWQPNGFLLDSMTRMQWSSLDKFERFCWVWNFKNQLMAGISELNVPYLQLKFEHLINRVHAPTEFSRLAEFIGVVPREVVILSKKVNESKGKWSNDWHKWTTKQRMMLHRLCGAQMTELGYGTEDDWLRVVDADERNAAEIIE
jgi:hypothetical protein